MKVTEGRHGRLFAVLVTALVLLGLSATAAQAAPKALPGNKAYSGYSHDIKTYAAGGAVTSGPVVAAGVGCSDKSPLYFQDSAATVSLGGIAVGTETTVSQGLKSGAVQETRSTYDAANVNLPLGVGFGVTADAISVRSSTFYNTGTGVFTTSSAMTVTNLQVKVSALAPAIITINGTVAPNTGFDLGPLGQLTLHATQNLGGAQFGAVGLMATGIKLSLLSLVSSSVGETYSSLYGETDQTYMFGAGEGLTVATSDNLLKVGPLVTAQLPCIGNGNLTANVAGVNGLPAALGSLGAVTSTATGTRSGLSADAVTTSEVAGVNLLGGLVSATAVKSTAHVSTADGASSVSTTGSGSVLTNLLVAGVPVSVNAAPNTTITLPGIGYVVINQQYAFASGIDVRALVVHVSAGNSLGLPTVDIVVARSFAVLVGPQMSAGAFNQAQKFLAKETTKSQQLSTNQKALVDGSLKKAHVLPQH